jgi:glycosyltransferase involved in cell wall biosynthesis
VDDIHAIWQRHHGFIQASRYEGYGLSLLEAMFCERMAVTTSIPAATEFVTDGETGFLAKAASVDEIADALERAWLLRDQWREMGLTAARRVEIGYPKDPVGDFLILIQEIG